MYVYMHKHERLGGSGGMLPHENFFEIRCSGIASEAVLGQNQSRSSYMAGGALHQILGCPRNAFAIPADFEFPQEKVLRLTEQQVG